METREIKFRAWDSRIEKWYASVNPPFEWEWEDTDWNGGETPAYTKQAPPEGVILMQYTGLKDKNGKEIYEGDILGEYSFSGDFEGQDEPFGKVYFDEDISAFCVEQTNGGWEYLHNIYQAPRVSVIGNIYSNPELIK